MKKSFAILLLLAASNAFATNVGTIVIESGIESSDQVYTRAHGDRFKLDQTDTGIVYRIKSASGAMESIATIFNMMTPLISSTVASSSSIPADDPAKMIFVRIKEGADNGHLVFTQERVVEDRVVLKDTIRLAYDLEFTLTSGTYEDYLNGKTVQGKATPDDFENYIKKTTGTANDLIGKIVGGVMKQVGANQGKSFEIRSKVAITEKGGSFRCAFTKNVVHCRSGRYRAVGSIGVEAY